MPPVLWSASGSSRSQSGYSRKKQTAAGAADPLGLTGIKSLLFHVYETFILPLPGLYGLCLLVREYRSRSFLRRMPPAVSFCWLAEDCGILSSEVNDMTSKAAVNRIIETLKGIYPDGLVLLHM